MIDDEQGDSGEGRVCVDQMFTLREIVEKAQEKKRIGDLIDLEKAYNRVNREALWQVLRMYEM